MDEKAARFKIFKNGPLKVEGKFVIQNEKDNELSTDKHVYLCRCNKSNNFPFCDGSHKQPE